MHEPVRAAPAAARPRRRRPGRLLAALVLASLSLGDAMTDDAQATSPDRFLMGVERIGVRCFVSSEVEGVDALRAEQGLCDAAVRAVRERGRAAGRDREVVALEVVDSRLNDPAVLTVLLHGHLQDAARVVPGAGTGAVLMTLSLDLYRNVDDPVGGNLFPAPPQAVFYGDGRGAETPADGPAGGALTAALALMIDAALAYGPTPPQQGGG